MTYRQHFSTRQTPQSEPIPTMDMVRNDAGGYVFAMGIAAKLVTIGMTSSGFSIADPNDPGQLDIIGFDTATPQVISNFSIE